MRQITRRLFGVLGAVCGLAVTRIAAAEHDLFLCRFMATTGMPDSTFNNTGFFGGPGCWTWDDGASGTNDEFYDVEVDSAGRIVACGNYSNPDGSERLLIARYTSTGLLDPTFGSGGWGFVQQPWPAPRACATDSAGNILAAVMFGPPSPGIAIVRFRAFDGSFDPSFVNWIPSATAFATDLKIAADGKIWVAGNGSGFQVARLTANGSLDASFGSGGIAVGTPNVATFGLAIDSSNRAVLATSGIFGALGPQMNAARLTSSGALDPFFNVGATGISFPPPHGHSYTSSILVDPSGKVLIAGRAVDNSAQSVVALARVDSTATLDPTFGQAGKQTTGFPGGASASKISRTSDGKIAVAGLWREPSTLAVHIALLRYTATGALDNTFSGDGKATHGFGPRSAMVNALALDGSARQIVAGHLYP